jgi:hypothetical protein
MLLPSQAPRRMRDRSSALCQGFGVAWTSGPRCGVRLALAWVADGCARASKTDGGVCLCAARFGPSSARSASAPRAPELLRGGTTRRASLRVCGLRVTRAATAADFVTDRRESSSTDDASVVRVRSTIDVIETNEEVTPAPPGFFISPEDLSTTGVSTQLRVGLLDRICASP